MVSSSRARGHRVNLGRLSGPMSRDCRPTGKWPRSRAAPVQSRRARLHTSGLRLDSPERDCNRWPVSRPWPTARLLEGEKRMRKPLWLLMVLVAVLESACAAAIPGPQAGGTAGGAITTARKQIVGALFADPAGLHQELTNPRGSTGSVPGMPELYALLDAGLTMWMLPKHVLEPAFLENKANFLGVPYWREAFVGAGPFKVEEWSTGSHTVLIANEDYVLGRPRLDEIEVRFFSDKGAIKAGLLSGAVQIQIGRGLNVEDSLQLGDTTQDIKVQLGGAIGDVLPICPQFVDADPPLVTNPPFRRPLLMAIGRQE